MSTISILIIIIASSFYVPTNREEENELLISKIKQLHNEIQDYIDEYGDDDFEDKIKKRLLSQ